MTDNIVIYGMDEPKHKLERMSGELKTDLERATKKLCCMCMPRSRRMKESDNPSIRDRNLTYHTPGV